METSRDYRVAEHIFRLTGEETLLDACVNYAPFLMSGASEASERIFDLTIVQGACPTIETRHVFTDTSDDDMPRIEVYRTSNSASGPTSEGWLFCVSMYKESETVCRIVCTADFRQCTLYIGTRDVRFAIDNAAMLLYAFTTVPKATLEMHASVIKREGKAYMFLGHSGTGKSTHSRQWMAAFEDATLLNDDNPIVRLTGSQQEGYRVTVYGSPWSGKTPCYNNDCAPVQAIVKLSQAPENKIRALRLPEAYAYMLSSSSGLKILPEMMDALYETISRLIQTVQVYGLECLPNTDAAQVCYRGTQG